MLPLGPPLPSEQILARRGPQLAPGRGLHVLPSQPTPSLPKIPEGPTSGCGGRSSPNSGNKLMLRAGGAGGPRAGRQASRVCGASLAGLGPGSEENG